MYILICLTTKIILSVCQKPDVGSDFIQDIFYQVKGNAIMENILKHYEKDTLVTEFIKDFNPKRKRSIDY